ncbi:MULTISPECIES: ABC transporter permease [Oligella]|uniref:Iron ABC transporter permease n=1 Tax=Oligella urethralis DNF00040 TaxID=1401065 RepID=A0A096BGZ3_9BURK|nr:MULTISPECIES: iron ABC transporter permease [Oligella]KGF32389.1 iron ABC transporter permease [Oligella urethralis DNF00040]OFV47800.1 iron ABC transporter permease [Oligella sp. HMSC09E12]PMC16580.1 iron ABC transporter permease [Oligella urethralis]SUA56726.1 Sulfate transport system permease protein CysW [Oligella urethralis]SUA66666.1 Sulfate transport system permease protein CysW [Oligella urethralis]
MFSHQAKLQRVQGWSMGSILALLFVLIVFLPIAALAVHAISSGVDHWANLWRYVLPAATKNTLILLGGVALVVSIVGTTTSWLVTAFHFPTRNILVWALLLPLSLPAYIMAFAYVDLLHPLGPIQGFIRDLLGYSSPRQFRLPDARSMWGGILVMSMSLYPYVYFTTRAMFINQPVNLIEAARVLGCNQRQAFFRLILPLARPAIVIGVVLALLETLNDIGASEFLGIQTLTTSIFNTWVARSNLGGAAQIACIMLSVVVLLIYIERQARRRQRYSNAQRMTTVKPRQLKGWQAMAAMLYCWLPILIGFVAPVWYLSWEAYKRLAQGQVISANLWKSAWNTVYVSLVATVITVLVGLLIVWVMRDPRFKFKKHFARIGSLGYAIPGTVLAIGLLSPYAWADSALASVLTKLFSLPPQLYIMGGISGLVIAYMVRFLAMTIGALEAGYERIPPQLDTAARNLGRSYRETFLLVHLPLLKPAIGTGAVLVFVDTMKELSITLLLRPMNFETLATWLYAEAARGTYEEGVIAALLIVAVGLIPVIFLARSQEKIKY